MILHEVLSVSVLFVTIQSWKKESVTYKEKQVKGIFLIFIVLIKIVVFSYNFTPVKCLQQI